MTHSRSRSRTLRRASWRIGLHWLLVVLLALVFVWTGGQKMTRYSPVENLVERSVYLDGSAAFFVVVMGAVQVAVGICLLVPPLRWVAVVACAVIAVVAASVFFVVPRACFNIWHAPWVLSETGQYLLMTVGLAVGGVALARSAPRR